jgi:dTDP-4-dehydrorhamnose reductase
VRTGEGGRPLLIFGASGTLGRALRQACELRGLRARVFGRVEADVTDPTAVDSAIRHLHPWAVINAAGYVRVDAAETDREACWHANVAGPVNLAAACRRRGVPLVTFSSDLVFDGAAGRAYRERDEPNPLNAYGTSKLEAERRVSDLLADVLVIRTSAFFGPFDDDDFAACVLRALDEGLSVAAPDDTVISPTYVPHLVHAALDLLIDGERGVWHLANRGAVTWYAFARAVALACGRPADGVVAARARDVWAPAVRPACSALTSERGAIMPPLEEAIEAYARDVRGADLLVSSGPHWRDIG